MDIVLTVSREFNMSPFQTLDADIDDFIMLLNYYLAKAKKHEIKKEEPPRKNDGFWDF